MLDQTMHHASRSLHPMQSLREEDKLGDRRKAEVDVEVALMVEKRYVSIYVKRLILFD